MNSEAEQPADLAIHRSLVMTGPWHPMLISATSIAVVFAQNRFELEFRWLVLPIVTAVTLTGCFTAILWGVTRSHERAGLIMSAAVLPIASYGYLFDGMQSVLSLLRIQTGINRFLLPTTVALIILGAFKAWHSHEPVEIAFKLNVTWSSALVFALALGLQPESGIRRFEVDPFPIPSVDRTRAPDIIYLILDGYAGSDVLREFYGFDNTPFFDALNRSGTHVVHESRSNYTQTPLSLASSLNAMYVDHKLLHLDRRSRDRRPLHQMIDRNAVMRGFGAAGYHLTVVASGWLPTSSSSIADDVLAVPGQFFKTEFTIAVLQTTLARVVMSSFSTIGSLSSRTEIHHAFDALVSLEPLAQPRFVFAHILAPHPPYVVDSAGNAPSSSANDGDPWENGNAYVAEVKFVNDRVLRLINVVRQRKGRPVVLIIQSDHGPYRAPGWKRAGNNFNEERTMNFMALRWPNGDPAAMDGRTPVNLFRVLARQMFDADLGILPDSSMFSPWYAPYDLTSVSRSMARSGAADSRQR